MLLEHLLIPNKNLPYGIMITYLFKYLKIDVSGETAFAPCIDIDCTPCKRMQAGARAHVPRAPPPP